MTGWEDDRTYVAPDPATGQPETDRRPAAQVLSDHMNDLAHGRTFGQAVVDHAGEWLPFPVRVAAGKAVTDVVARWRSAGSPSDADAAARPVSPGAAAGDDEDGPS